MVAQNLCQVKWGFTIPGSVFTPPPKVCGCVCVCVWVWCVWCVVCGVCGVWVCVGVWVGGVCGFAIFINLHPPIEAGILSFSTVSIVENGMYTTFHTWHHSCIKLVLYVSNGMMV